MILNSTVQLVKAMDWDSTIGCSVLLLLLLVINGISLKIVKMLGCNKNIIKTR